MTAEIAIANKYAVALAADSAVTISRGDRDEKIFDTADKIFELSRVLPIGIMIYNGMDFAEIPYQTVVCNFRARNEDFVSVSDAANAFLAYLNEVGIETPEKVKTDELFFILAPLIEGINSLKRKRVDNYFDAEIPESKTLDDVRADIEAIPNLILEEYKQRFIKYEDATFYGDGILCFDESFEQILKRIIKKNFDYNNEDQALAMAELCKLRLSKKVLSNNHTGVIIAGFGRDEIFPTINALEIDGLVCNRLKYSKINSVDIDRLGKRASVLPFAQKEMVERFLYGMDRGIQDEVIKFCRESVKTIRTSLLERISLENEDEKQLLILEAEAAEEIFLKSLSDRAFESLRNSSQSEIEDMVEFMPKPELAKMAEALVNLTSIKRKVSRGFETVGGPIDVAVISRTEGFVWVRRKHYFSAELNVRYLQKVRRDREIAMEESDARNSTAG